MAVGGCWLKSLLGLVGSSLGPLRTGPVRVAFGFVLFLTGLVNGLIGWFSVGLLDALKAKWCGGMSFKESLMTGDKVYDEVGWVLFGND
jgi:hypothetical protein